MWRMERRKGIQHRRGDVQRLLAKKVMVECANYEKCGNMVERTLHVVFRQNRFVCFDCKVKRKREYFKIINGTS